MARPPCSLNKLIHLHVVRARAHHKYWRTELTRNCHMQKVSTWAAHLAHHKHFGQALAQARHKHWRTERNVERVPDYHMLKEHCHKRMGVRRVRHKHWRRTKGQCASRSNRSKQARSERQRGQRSEHCGRLKGDGFKGARRVSKGKGSGGEGEVAPTG